MHFNMVAVNSVLLNYILGISCFLCLGVSLYGQDNLQNEKTVVEQAHDKQLQLEDFTATENSKFKVKAFTLETAQTNTIHHWFAQVLTEDNLYVNYGSIELKKGYLKSNPNIPFVFMNPVVALCNEGKYIIGFVNVNTPGVYVLNLAIDNFGAKDKITVEIEIFGKKKSAK